ncbi:MAG: hypothetical protein ACJA2S_001222 [Cyclobacteriaceae bacterium]|jgi:hypothetical protein
MKKINIVLVLYVLALNTISAQEATDKGTIWIGGTAGFSSVSSEGATATSITLSPSVSHFVVNNIFVGGAVNWSRVSENGNGGASLGIGPHLGLSFNNGGSSSIPYVAGGLRYLQNRTDQSGLQVLNRSGSDFFVSGGFNMIVRDSLGILIEASYHIQSFQGGASFNSFVLSIGVTGILN